MAEGAGDLVKYFVTIGEETREVDLTEEGVVLDGRPLRAEIAIFPGASEGHLRLGDRGYIFRGRRVDGGWAIEMHGRRFVLGVENERTRAIRELTGVRVPPPGRPEVRAPMPGLVVRVLVAPGQTVETDTGLVVVEAMKMENEIRAERPGTIASVEVVEGQTVNQDETLLTFEMEER